MRTKLFVVSLAAVAGFALAAQAQPQNLLPAPDKGLGYDYPAYGPPAALPPDGELNGQLQFGEFTGGVGAGAAYASSGYGGGGGFYFAGGSMAPGVAGQARAIGVARLAAGVRAAIGGGGHFGGGHFGGGFGGGHFGGGFGGR